MFHQEITVMAEVANLETVTAFVDECLERFDCSPRAQIQMNVAVDELFSNIVHYAYPSDTGAVTVRVEITGEPTAAIITFIDSGIPYDPLSCKDPDITLSAEERQIGGLGIYMVKKSMDEITYQYLDGKNVLRIKKYLSAGNPE
ncbi:MAG: ATP-binding protein [Aristaeellaceae bacterium]